MSFSSDVKEDLTRLNILNNMDLIKSELFGYLLTANATIKEKKIEFITENEFNIENFYKILFKLNIEYEPEINGKIYKAVILDKSQITDLFKNFELTKQNEIVRGAFLGSGSITEPSKSYHLEIIFSNKENAQIIQKLCEVKEIKLKILENKEKFNLYIKEGEEISKFLAYIGANKSVITFEEIRVMKEIKNNVNRKVNCETANLNKVIEASIIQVNDIKYIMSKNKFKELTPELKEVAEIRLKYPEETLKDLGKHLENPIGKSGINYRLKKIHEFAEDLRKEEK